MDLEQARKQATITIEQAGQLIGLGRGSAYAAAQRGEIPTRRFGRRLLVPVPALLSLLGDDAASN